MSEFVSVYVSRIICVKINPFKDRRAVLCGRKALISLINGMDYGVLCVILTVQVFNKFELLIVEIPERAECGTVPPPVAPLYLVP